jgi:(p)ppGpp synthase/HD superfamily hydrolase
MKTATFEDALALAANSHKGQVDKAGQPYILHPLRVMTNLGRGATEAERSAAVLHDVVEDCDVSFDDLRGLGFSEEVVTAVDALTKRPDEQENYMKAIRRLASNPIARRVKIGDLTDNLDLSRIPNPTEKDLTRVEKYRQAKKFLEELESSS